MYHNLEGVDKMYITQLCRHCNGAGTNKANIDVSWLLAEIQAHLEPESMSGYNKIAVIKALREKIQKDGAITTLGLRNAKDLVEQTANYAKVSGLIPELYNTARR